MQNQTGAVAIRFLVLFFCFVFIFASLPVQSLSDESALPGTAQEDNINLQAGDDTAGRAAPGVTDDIIEYLIIAPEAMADAYEPLKDWKTRKGVPAKIVTTEYINSTNASQPDLGIKIHDFLADFNVKSQYNLKWILLGADDEWIPARWIYTQASKTLQYASDYYPTDYYYAGLASDWNTDGDQYWGEPGEADFDPNAFVGRLPVDNAQQVKNYVDQLIAYEQSPPLDGWLSTALMTDALFDTPNILDDFATPKTDEGYGEWEDNGLEATNRIIPYLDENFEFKHIYDYNQIPGGSYSPVDDMLDQTSFVSEINKGYGIVNVVSHSFLSGNGTVSYEGDGQTTSWRRFFYYDDAANMINGDKRSFVYFSDCDVFNFTERDDTNFEQMFTNPFGGAIAAIGPTGSTYRGESDPTRSLGNWWIADRYWYLFKNGYLRPGECLYRTKYEYYYYMIDTQKIPYDFPSMRVNMVSYNVLGDPEVPIWPGDPEYMKVDIPKLFVYSNNISLSVTDSGTNLPLQDALVTVSGDDGTYLRIKTDTDGKIYTPFSFPAPTTYNITITKDGYLPYVEDLKIYPEPSDLTIGSSAEIDFKFPTDPPIANSEGNISVWITNLEVSKPETGFWVNFTDKYTYMSKTYTDYLGEVFVSDMPANDKVQIFQTWKPTKPVEHTIEVKIDPLNLVEEINENNNFASRALKVKGPDLRIIPANINVEPESKASVGDSITINATVFNIDWGQAHKVEIEFYDGNPDGNGILLGTSTYNGILNINEKISFKIDTPPITKGGEHLFYVIVDPNNAVIESDELNNRAFFSYDFNNPPSMVELDPIRLDEDKFVERYLDLLDPNILSDDDNLSTQLEIKVISISNPACGFTLREGRYIDIKPDPNWWGNAVVNLSVSDGLTTIYSNILVDIRPVDDPPIIEDLSLVSDVFEIGDNLVLNIRISDVDSERLKVSVSSSTQLLLGKIHPLDVYFGTEMNSGLLEWDGKGNLTFRYEIQETETGQHSIKVDIKDDTHTVSDTVNLELKAEKESDAESTFLGMDSETGYLIIILLIVILLIIVVLALRRVKKEKKEISEQKEEEGGEPTRRTQKKSRPRRSKRSDIDDKTSGNNSTDSDESIEE